MYGRDMQLTVPGLAVDPLLVFGEVGRRIVSEDRLLGRPRTLQLLLLTAAAFRANFITW